MWLFTRQGFCSIVAHHNKRQMLLRFRLKKDAVAYKELIVIRCRPQGNLPIKATPKADYPYRLLLPKPLLPLFLSSLSYGVDYGNFKSAVTPDHHTQRARAYLQVWATLARLDADADETHMTVGGNKVSPAPMHRGGDTIERGITHHEAML